MLFSLNTAQFSQSLIPSWSKQRIPTQLKKLLVAQIGIYVFSYQVQCQISTVSSHKAEIP